MEVMNLAFGALNPSNWTALGNLILWLSLSPFLTLSFLLYRGMIKHSVLFTVICHPIFSFGFSLAHVYIFILTVSAQPDNLISTLSGANYGMSPPWIALATFLVCCIIIPLVKNPIESALGSIGAKKNTASNT